MTILLLDASFFEGVIALLSEGKILREERVKLGPLAEEDLAERFALFQEVNIEALALGTGPGSFTGMRVAAALLLPFAYARKIPLITFSSLEGIDGKGNPVAVDGKRGRLYFLEKGKVSNISIEELPKGIAIASPHALNKIYPSLSEREILEAAFKSESVAPLIEERFRKKMFTPPLEVKLNYYQSI